MLLHCVVDAILGALGLPDIGQIFPDSDPKWKGAASSVFIKEAVSFCTFPLMFISVCRDFPYAYQLQSLSLWYCIVVQIFILNYMFDLVSLAAG